MASKTTCLFTHYGVGQLIPEKVGQFGAESVDHIERKFHLLQTDPAIKKQLLEADLYNWYGSAALGEYLKYHDRIWKLKP